MLSLKKILPLLLIVLLVVSVVYFVQNRKETADAYERALTEARHYAELGVYTEASKQYASALELNRSLPLLVEVGEMLLKAEDYRSAVYWYEDNLLADYPRSAETYLYGMQVYEKRKQFDEFFSIYDTYVKRELESPQVEALEQKYHNLYQLLGSYDEVGEFNSISGMAPVRYGDNWGAVNKKGNTVIPYKYKNLGSISSLGPAVTKDDRAICVDANGSEMVNSAFIQEKDPGFGEVKAFKTVYSGLFPAWNGTIWNYYDEETLEKRFGGYQDVLPIANQIGAVSQDGKNWALISADGTLLTQPTYSEVLVDGKGVCSRKERVIVREGDAYYLIDIHGNRVNGIPYSDARAFNDSSMAAVKKDGKWLFINMQGEELSLGEFEEAESFSNGYAAVKKDGRWGYIDEQGMMAIDNTFFSAGPFSSTGLAFVQIENGSWELLSLLRMNH